MPAPLVSRWEGAESLSFSIFPSPPHLSLSPVGQRPSPPGKPPACGRPAAASSRRIGVPTLGGCSATLGPPPIPLLSHCQRAPTPAPTPFTAELGASLGEQTQQIAERKSVEPVPSARRPDPRPLARLSRPFRCSSQDGGQAIPGPLSTSLLQDRRRKRGSGRRDPAPACAPGAGVDTITAVPAALSPAGCRAGSGRRGGPEAIQRIPRVPLDFRGRTRPQTPGFGPCSLTRRRLQ